MSALSVISAVKTLVVPNTIPSANVDIWMPASFATYPHVVLSLARYSEEVYLTSRKKIERHFIQVTFFQQPEVAGGLQLAQQAIYDFIETAKANVRANPQLATASVPACLMAGVTVDGKHGMVSCVDMALDQSNDEPLAHGYLVIPVEDLTIGV